MLQTVNNPTGAIELTPYQNLNLHLTFIEYETALAHLFETKYTVCRSQHGSFVSLNKLWFANVIVFIIFWFDLSFKRHDCIQEKRSPQSRSVKERGSQMSCGNVSGVVLWYLSLAGGSNPQLHSSSTVSSGPAELTDVL